MVSEVFAVDLDSGPQNFVGGIVDDAFVWLWLNHTLGRHIDLRRPVKLPAIYVPNRAVSDPARQLVSVNVDCYMILEDDVDGSFACKHQLQHANVRHVLLKACIDLGSQSAKVSVRNQCLAVVGVPFATDLYVGVPVNLPWEHESTAPTVV
jgi:hypothetical protein